MCSYGEMPYDGEFENEIKEKILLKPLPKLPPKYLCFNDMFLRYIIAILLK